MDGNLGGENFLTNVVSKLMRHVSIGWQWFVNKSWAWLVVWNIFSIYWEESSQLTNIFQRGSNHQPEDKGEYLKQMVQVKTLATAIVSFRGPFLFLVAAAHMAISPGLEFAHPRYIILTVFAVLNVPWLQCIFEILGGVWKHSSGTIFGSGKRRGSLQRLFFFSWGQLRL